MGSGVSGRPRIGTYYRFDRPPPHIYEKKYYRYALLTHPNAHTKFDQNWLRGRFTIEVLTSSFTNKYLY